MHVCYFGTYKRDYARNRILIDGLRSRGMQVTECHADLWGADDTAGKVAAGMGGWRNPRFLTHAARIYAGLAQQYRAVGPHDIVILGYAGQMDVYVARWLARRSGVPVVLDVFMSIYLIMLERRLDRRSPMTARLVYWLERIACRLADALFLDTPAYVDFFHQTYGLPPERFYLIPTGADERLFYPRPRTPPKDGRLRVVYVGGFLRAHGLPTMIEAAARLSGAPVCFELIGDGPERPAAMALAAQHGLTNVTFTGWLDRRLVPERMAQADVVLGVFGKTEQSLRTIHNKIYEGMAMGLPVVTGDSPTVRAELRDDEDLILVPREDPAALAATLLALRTDPDRRARIGALAYRTFCERYTMAAIGALAETHLQHILERHGRASAAVGHRAGS